MSDIFDDESLFDESDPVEEVESVGTVIEPEFPFWRLDKRQVIQFCKVAKEISLKSSDLLSKSAYLEYQSGSVTLSVTNKIVYFSQTIQLKNVQKVLQVSFIIPIKQLESIAQYSSDLIIYKEGELFYASLMGGKEVIDQVFADSSIYEFPPLGERKLIIQPQMLKDELSIMLKLLMFAVVPEDRKVVVEGGFSYGNFLSILTKQVSQLPDMVLRNVDAKNLYLMIDAVDEAGIVINESSERFSFCSSNFKCSTIKSPYVKSGMVNMFNFDRKTNLVLDSNLAANVFSFLSLRASESGIGRIFNVDGKIKASFQDKKTKFSEFVLGSSLSEIDADLQVALAKRIFMILKPKMVTLELLVNQIAYLTEDLTVVQGVRMKQ